MSRINDALKRARAIQADRPAGQVETAPVHRTAKLPRSSATWIAASLIGVLLCVSVGMVLLAKSNRQKPTAIAIATQVGKPESTASPVRPPLNARPKKLEAMVPPVATPPAVATPIPVERPGSPSVAVPAVAGPSRPPTAPALRLQGILYRPDHPSAFINGRMVSVGDWVGGARVSAITRESATLIVNGVTTVLRLPP